MGHVKAYLGYCAELIGRVEALLLELAAKGEPPRKINKIAYFLKHAVRQINQIDRRLLKGETIPHNEKVFSIFEPHTRWISKGKAGRPVELGVQVCIVECQYQFILHRPSNQPIFTSIFDKTYLNQYVEEISGAICDSPYGCEFRLG